MYSIDTQMVMFIIFFSTVYCVWFFGFLVFLLSAWEICEDFFHINDDWQPDYNYL